MAHPAHIHTIEHCPSCLVQTDHVFVRDTGTEFLRRCLDCMVEHASERIVPARPSEVEFPGSLGRLS